MKLGEFITKYPKSETYYHCCSCGNIYHEEERINVILNLKEETGVSAIPRILEDFVITTSYCKPCADKFNEQILNYVEDKNKMRSRR